MPMGWAPLSWRPLSMLVDMTLAATVAVPASGYALNYTLQIYASTDTANGGVIPFTTLPSDTLALQYFKGTLKKGLEFHVSIVSGDDIGRAMSSGVGEFQLDNADRGYDTFYNNNTFDGRRVVFKYGQITIPGEVPSSFDTYQTLLDGVIQDVFLDSDQLRGTIRDNAFKLDVPVSPNAYGGTGTTDGDAALAGKRKPLSFGVANNVTAVQINAANLVYQIHDGSVNAIPTVYDSAYALSGPDADYASYAALIAATINNGHFATCKALGLFRLGATPFGLVTCDVQGDNGGTGGYITDSASIARRMIAFAATQLDLVDEGSFLTLAAAQPAVVGYYLGLDENKTARQAINDILGGIGACGGFRREGVFEVIRFVAPAGTAVDSYTADDIKTGTFKRIELPSGYNPPPKRQRVTYAHNWTVQPDVSAGVTDARKQLLKTDSTVASHSKTSLASAIATAHILAQDPDPITGYFRDSTDAVAEADRLLALKGGAVPALYVFMLKNKGLTRKIGDVISLTFAPNGVTWFDLNEKHLTVVGRVDNTTDGTVELTAFGASFSMPLWGAAKAAAAAGTRNAKLLCIGDSLTTGYGASGVPYAGAEPLSYPAVLAGLLSSYHGSRENLFGSHTATTFADLLAYDIRLTATTGWGLFGVGSSIGGAVLTNASNTTGALNFTPSIPVDTFDIYSPAAIGCDNLTIAVDGGSVIATVNLNVSTTLIKTTVSAGALGSHTVNLKRTVNGGNGVFVSGIVGYNSAVKEISVYNGGWSGSTAANWNDATFPGWSPKPAIPIVAPDLAVIFLGANEILGGVAPATFSTNLQAIITAAKLSGDVLLVTPPPVDTGLASAAAQQAIVDVVYALALTNKCNVIDLYARWGSSYTNSLAFGRYGDGIHASGAGYSDIANAIRAAV
jgi:lysophospholipase L1-like esterase